MFPFWCISSTINPPANASVRITPIIIATYPLTCISELARSLGPDDLGRGRAVLPGEPCNQSLFVGRKRLVADEMHGRWIAAQDAKSGH